MRLDNPMRVHGMILAGLFGPGDYDIQNGIVAPLAAPQKDARVTGVAGRNRANGTSIWHIEEPCLVTVRSNEESPLVFHDLHGRPFWLLQHSTAADKEGRTTFRKLPAEPVRLGLGDPGNLEFEFLVKSPKP